MHEIWNAETAFLLSGQNSNYGWNPTHTTIWLNNQKKLEWIQETEIGIPGYDPTDRPRYGGKRQHCTYNKVGCCQSYKG